MTLSPLSRPLYVMAKPAGSRCNLACEYCYYLEKEHLYASEPAATRGLMTDETLERFIRQYLESQTQPEVLFTWHGGEPLLRPLSFYRKALKLQRQYARGRHIDNALQTNGTLLTDEWCRFFREHNWLIGISIDGPEHLHDAYRRARGGQSSFRRVMRGIELLQKHGVEWNVMGVVNNLNADHALEVYDFYKSIGARYIQFTPIVERMQQHPDGRHLAAPIPIGQLDNLPLDNLPLDNLASKTLPSHPLPSHPLPSSPFPSDVCPPPASQLSTSSVSPAAFARFACEMFDEWVRRDVGTVYVQLFDATLACWMGVAPGVCSMAETCGHAAVMEANGDVYSCDHFVFPEYLLGNIHDQTLTAMMYSPRQQTFGRAKRDALPRQCRQCPWLFACNGGCPKDRFVISADGEPGLNYLCEGYRLFFSHVAPAMDFMRGELLHQRPPANVMQWIWQGNR